MICKKHQDSIFSCPCTVQPKSQGVKHDEGKPRMELLDPLWLEEVAKVLGFGASKYEAHGWRKGLAITRLVGAGLRHVLAFMRGEDRDPESGLLHLAHASCCLMFATNMLSTRPDLDDRFRAVESLGASKG